jgi:protein ImuB
MPDGMLLDDTGVPHLFGGEARMLAEIRSRLAQYGFTARIGTGNTIGMAWALARYEAKDARSLPVEALRIDGDSARTLRRLGLKTVGQLVEIPRSSLARRFRGETVGENVLLQLDAFTGARDEPLNPLNPPTSFMAHRALMEPVIHAEALETVLTGLVNELCRLLEQQGKGALRLILKLFRTDGSRANLPAGFAAPTHDPRHMLRILKPRLETVDAGFGIDAMTLEARESAEARVQQYGFTEDDSTLAIEQLNDRVLNRHDSPLASLEAVESHIPERAERAKAPGPAAAAPRGAARARKTASEARAQPTGDAAGLERPLLIFEAPEPAKVIAAVPDGPPMRLTWRRVTRRVAKSQGPERVAPEWWRLGAGERPRDYYVIEDEQGRRYWLYREGLYGEAGEEPPRWFVHGLSA